MIRGIKVGFSGSQYGMNQTQAEITFGLLGSWRQLDCINEFHHGDCVQADNYAHQIAQHLGYETHIHPPIDERKRAFSCDGDRHYLSQDYLTRNHIIVEMVDRMIFTPREEEEITRSGTWSTLRYADKCQKKTWLILPSGRVVGP